MKKLNKKGFTLVELIAVVVILLSISVIAVTSISAAIERNRNKENDSKIKILQSYAKLYYDQYKNEFGDSTNGYIKLTDLYNVGLNEEELYDADGLPFKGCIEFNSGNFYYTEEGCPDS